MEEQIKEQSNGNFLREMLFVLKRNLILILVVVILVTAVGTAYAMVRKPVYTGSMRVNLTSEEHNTTSITEMQRYVDTIIDFADEGKVLKRANYYYTQWCNSGEPSSAKYVSDDDNFKNVPENMVSDDDFYKRSAVSVSTVVVENATMFVFFIKYKDVSKADASDKSIILARAFRDELTSIDKTTGTNKYFPIDIEIELLGPETPSQDITKMAIIIIAFAIGVILALIAVYIKNAMDNTVKSKEELEKITETPVIACIKHVGGEQSGK